MLLGFYLKQIRFRNGLCDSSPVKGIYNEPGLQQRESVLISPRRWQHILVHCVLHSVRLAQSTEDKMKSGAEGGKGHKKEERLTLGSFVLILKR